MSGRPDWQAMLRDISQKMAGTWATVDADVSAQAAAAVRDWLWAESWPVENWDITADVVAFEDNRVRIDLTVTQRLCQWSILLDASTRAKNGVD